MDFDPPFPSQAGDGDSTQSDISRRGSSRGSSSSGDLPKLEDRAWLLWAPRNHRSDIRPTLRFLIETSNDDGTPRETIKYFTLKERTPNGAGIRYHPDVFTTELFQEQEPFYVPKGAWKQASICFFPAKDGDEDFLATMVTEKTYDPLPEMNPEAIWAEKPKLEYTDLSVLTRSLRGDIPIGYSDRTRIVFKHTFQAADMVMKIWPSPMSMKEGLEREMMAYRACDGMDLTPKFLGHVAEEGRVVGMLIEYIEGAHKPSNDDEKESCRQEMDRFHRLTGWHRNPRANHKDNFLIKDGRVYIIDLAMAYTPEDVTAQGDDWAEQTV